MTAFIQFWARDTWLAHVGQRGRPLEHTAGNGFAAVRPGDEVFVVGREADELLVLARIVLAPRSEYLVGASRMRSLFSQDEAELILEQPVWEARHHVLACPGQAEELRFDRVLPDDALEPDRRSVRELAPGEADALRAICA